MPILIQDRIIMNNSQVPQAILTLSGEHGPKLTVLAALMLCPVKLYYPYTWGGFDGDTPVVNGKVYPYFEVKPQAYRFRFLNGCNSRHVSFSLPHGPTMWQVRVISSPIRRFTAKSTPSFFFFNTPDRHRWRLLEQGDRSAEPHAR